MIPRLRHLLLKSHHPPIRRPSRRLPRSRRVRQWLQLRPIGPRSLRCYLRQRVWRRRRSLRGSRPKRRRSPPCRHLPKDGSLVRRAVLACRKAYNRSVRLAQIRAHARRGRRQNNARNSKNRSRGDERDRTVGLLSAIQALSQLSYIPDRPLPSSRAGVFYARSFAVQLGWGISTEKLPSPRPLPRLRGPAV